MKYKITTLKNSIPFSYTLRAQSLQEAKQKAELQDNLPPITITPISQPLSFIPQKHIIQTLEQLHLLLSSHLSLQECFALMIPNTSNKQLKTILEAIYQNLENGLDLYESFAPYEKVFGTLSLKMLYFGVKSNNLTQCLLLLLSHLKSRQDTKSKIRSAIFYPLIVLALTLICFGVLLVFVIPQFAELFASNHLSLPIYTQILLTLSEFLQSYGLALLIGVGIGGGIFYYSFYSHTLLYQPLLSFALLLPLVRQILLSNYRYEYCCVLSMLLFCNIDLKTATSLAQKCLFAKALQNKLQNAQTALANGKTLSQALDGFLSPLSIALLHSAQQSGKIPEILEQCAQEYKRQAQNLNQMLISSIEPVLTILLGGFVLFLALGIFVPIWEMH